MIRTMTRQDFVAFWPVFKEIIAQQETYAFDPQMDEESAYQLWCEQSLKSFVYVEQSQVLGSYYLKTNAMGPSDHISNCGYMISPQARGKGLARKLCEHSQQQALELGFRAMQFNSVVSSNEVAVKLWKKLGYDIIGTIPKAYRHPKLGLVDSYIMYKWLE
ncbi:GNAT family N-acetyltransferase [Pseudoalteromonas luteoviolacea]|uniref:GNAT family N-acetyltransferase n=1 Tax=Pseudoalteromonas luteoviolacea TaxID=43657 RepID=UPI001B37581A|nr:GNAT family N-acetyltransferase [Pseudoalteromonas luteoviolacea]MBQ4814332.1 GNAT family N-acetyltransferase [Pseudoalteromonas luteoviolacea]